LAGSHHSNLYEVFLILHNSCISIDIRLCELPVASQVGIEIDILGVALLLRLRWFLIHRLDEPSWQPAPPCSPKFVRCLKWPLCLPTLSYSPNSAVLRRLKRPLRQPTLYYLIGWSNTRYEVLCSIAILRKYRPYLYYGEPNYEKPTRAESTECAGMKNWLSRGKRTPSRQCRAQPGLYRLRRRAVGLPSGRMSAGSTDSVGSAGNIVCASTDCGAVQQWGTYLKIVL